eukprot:Em0006g715a
MSSVGHLTCHLCSKPFNDPRILPCLHSFCCQCLNHEIEKAVPKQSIQCPTCLRTVPSPVAGASAFPQNHHLEFEVEVADCVSKFISNSVVPCNFCANGCANPAESFCCSCHKFLCKGGQDSHSRVPTLLQHRVLVVSEESASLLPTAMQPIVRFCSQLRHTKQELDYYCKTCSCFICRECFIAYHKDHSISELSAVAETHREDMRVTLQCAQEVSSLLNSAIGTKKRMIHQLDISQNEAESTIKGAFEKLMELLDERKKALLSELKDIADSKITPLNLQKEYLEKMQQDIGRYTKLTTHILQTHTDYEVVALGGVVPTEVKAITKNAEGASRTPIQCTSLKASLQMDSLVRELSKFGKVLDLSTTQSKFSFMIADKVNTSCNVKVEVGKRYECSDLQAKCELKPESPDGLVIPEVADHGDGTYTITLTPQITGPHRLHITVDGQQLEKTPNSIECTTLGSPQQVIDVDQPYCVATDENGNIYVGSNNDCIYLFDQDGHLKGTIGSSGSSNGEFNVPADIYIKEETMYVADLGNNRIQKLTIRGEFLHAFGEFGSGQGQFSGPAGIVVDSKGRLIVSDRDNNRVQVFNQDGGWLFTIDGNESDDSVFTGPCGLTLDPQGNIHVAAGASNSIKVFSTEGTYIGTYGDVNGPTGIAVDSEGYSLISEGDGHCLSIFDPQGRKVHTVGNLNNPTGVTLDARSSSVYVANFVGCNVLKYTV